MRARCGRRSSTCSTARTGLRWYLYYTAGHEPTTWTRSASRCWSRPAPIRWGRTRSRPTCSTRSPNNTWELDPSILQLNGKLYLLGTFYNGVGSRNFIRELSNPWTAAGTRRLLRRPRYSWETVGGAVNEGAEVLQRNGRTFIIFSAVALLHADYKLGMLTYNGGDPLTRRHG